VTVVVLLVRVKGGTLEELLKCDIRVGRKVGERHKCDMGEGEAVKVESHHREVQV
jgi:hypothetical protein